jgi:hypothetical protein
MPGEPEPWLITGALAFLLLFTVMLFWVFSRLSKQPAVASEIRPLVAMPGRQDTPAVSPDGSQVAFEYLGAPNPGIYIALIGGEKPLQLTENENDHEPTWHRGSSLSVHSNIPGNYQPRRAGRPKQNGFTSQGDGVVYIVKILKKAIFGEFAGYRKLGKEGDTAEPRSNCNRHVREEDRKDYLLRQVLKIYDWHSFENCLVFAGYG